MASKYDALANYLKNLSVDRIRMDIDEIEKIVGELPTSARADRTWWGNSRHHSRTQSAAWLGAGWKVEDGGTYIKGYVTFVRK